MKPIDRETSLVDARTNAETLIRHLGLHAQIENHGSCYGTTSCNLISAEGGDVKSRGAGKGSTVQESLTGALFEALEHYFQAEYQNYITPISLDIGDYYISRGLDDIPLSIVSQQRDRKIATLPYRTHSSQSDDLLLPLALSNPLYLVSRNQADCPDDTFDYAALNKYSSTNGMSVGSTLDEALIHCMCENIERICLGELLTSVIGVDRPHGIRVVDKTSLPTAIGEMLHYTEALVGCEVCLIDMTNGFKTPAFLAYINSEERYERQFGLGCSLYPEIAVTRAITEILQLRVYSQGEEYNNALIIEENEKEFSSFEQDEWYRTFSILRIGDLLRQGEDYMAHTDFNSHSRPGALSGLAEQRQRLQDNISGNTSCFRYTHYFDNPDFNFSCINGYILPLDNTFLLSKGVKVSLPNTHLQAMIQ